MPPTFLFRTRATGAALAGLCNCARSRRNGAAPGAAYDDAYGLGSIPVSYPLLPGISLRCCSTSYFPRCESSEPRAAASPTSRAACSTPSQSAELHSMMDLSFCGDSSRSHVRGFDLPVHREERLLPAEEDYLRAGSFVHPCAIRPSAIHVVHELGASLYGPRRANSAGLFFTSSHSTLLS